MTTIRIRSRRWRGASLVELLVALAIIAILASLLLVAVQYSRNAARRTVCQNNLRQLSMAMRTFVETRKRYPDESPPDQAGGWVVELMPFLEEQSLQDELKARPALVGANVSPLVRKRPPLFTCPNGFDGDSALAGIPATHYLFSTPHEMRRSRQRFQWTFIDALSTNRSPWAAGPEGPQWHHFDDGAGIWPHSSGYNEIHSWDESCSLVVPQPRKW
jgi:prepilin-type N-terminal cleavage/methylation domain-containing protein